MPNIMIMITAYLCVLLLWLLKCWELKQFKELCRKLSEQNDALWKTIEHLVQLKTMQCSEEEAGTDV